ncbi:BAR and SH3 domain-containing protein [Aspergillus undulatus]|uniref:BAR and SH3 domain-containing protein n=1 Tax=Aspergillus undulatus TaxID=1810928 RepID=UPI003CCCBE15
MQSVQRQFGRFMKRSADDNQVALLLKDFDQIDKLLDKIVDSTKAWRDAWSSLLTHQDRILIEFEGLYAPIIGSADPTPYTPVPTPEATLARTAKLKEEYADMAKDLLRELSAIDDRMIDPASQAKECLTPFKKAIKKRDDRKLDYERHHGRVETYSKKAKRSERDNSAMVKAEDDLARAREDYHAADEHLRQHLPPLINAVFSLLPRLLAAQIEIQNSLLANYYTVIYGYCEQEQFPYDPPQSLDKTVDQWEQAYHPVQEQIESFATIANGKIVRSSAQTSNERRPSNPLSSLNRLRSSNNVPTQQSQPEHDAKPSLGARSKSYASTHSIPPLNKDTLPGKSTASLLESRTPSSHSIPPIQQHTNTASPPIIPLASKPSLSALAGKKKPPPPPPKPRSASSNMTFVTALYDFGGQGAGDLVFQEGDRIRVLKRTDSTDDWWEGELHGVKGSFPANYVEIAQ